MSFLQVAQGRRQTPGEGSSFFNSIDHQFWGTWSKLDNKCGGIKIVRTDANVKTFLME